MLALSAKDSWLIVLILISIGGFVFAARLAPRLTEGRAALYSVGFSLAFTLLALAAGIAVLR
jgi:ketol-acid reductoisomerase